MIGKILLGWLGLVLTPWLWAETLRIRDLETGALLPAEIWVASERAALVSPEPTGATRWSTADGRSSAALLPASAWLRIEASAHEPLIARHVAGAASYTYWLKPKASVDESVQDRSALAESGADPDSAPKAKEASAALAEGHWRLEARVLDGSSLAPVGGVRVWVEPTGWSAHSDAGGRLQLGGELPPATQEPAFLHLYLEDPHSGQIVLIDSTLPWAAGSLRRLLHLGEAELQPRHRQFANAAEQAMQAEVTPPVEPVALGGTVHDPPPSIRVGFADANCTATCCTGSCSHVCVFDLESYVRRGITHEWIASWQPHALRAGTAAYRGYGAWRVSQPIRPNYDICSSACCQVNGGTIHSNGSAAVARTRGLLLERNGAWFSAEYSAENNCLLGTQSCSNPDLSCGDGFNGSPSRGWPCLSDPVGAGRDCFGHGRGMSQWGTQRWAASPHGRLWPWIVDQYYNAHGNGSGQRTAQLTRVLALESGFASPSTVVPGATLNLSFGARNRAAEAHERVLLGASIRRGGDPFLSDPANDRLVSLAPGTSTPTRSFVVPPTAPNGSYDLYLSLSLDIDENASLGSADLVQALLVLPNAVSVQSGPDRLFADGFESPVPPLPGATR